MAKFLWGLALGLLFAIQYVPLQSPTFYGLACVTIILGIISLFVRIK